MAGGCGLAKLCRLFTGPFIEDSCQCGRVARHYFAFGPAERTSGLAPSAYFSKLLMNRLASFLAVAS